MDSPTESECLLKERQWITFSVFHAITVFFIFSLLISLGISLLTNHSIKEHLICGTCLIFLTLSLLLIKFVSADMGTAVYISLSFIFITALDSFSLFVFDSAEVLYSFPLTMGFMFIRKPAKYYITAIFCLAISVKIAFESSFSIPRKVGIILILLSSVFLVAVLCRFLSKERRFQIGKLKKINDTTIRVLGRISELRDSETEGHLKRVESFIDILARSLMDHDSYRGYVTARYIEDLKAAAYLHDIGKVGIADSILLKPERLTESEYGEMKKHSLIGYELLRDAMKDIEHESLYDLALRMARHHHERWDGTGYPDRLKGEEIPLCARLMALVDVYDALISHRPYKAPYPHGEAVDIIRNGSGTHFDPLLVELFLKKADEINGKSLMLSDSPGAPIPEKGSSRGESSLIERSVHSIPDPEPEPSPSR